MAKHSPKCLLQKNKLRAAFESRLDTIYKILQKIEHGFGIEDIHVFRVEIKKLKALLSLLKTNTKNSSKLKISKKLQKIYKLVGQIRILQLQQEYISKEINKTGISHPVRYLDILSKKTDIYKLKAGECSIRKNILVKEKHDIGKNSPDELLLVTLESFIKNKIKAIKKLLSHGAPDENSMHLIRKHLKDIQYNISFIKTAGSKKAVSGFPKVGEIQPIASLLGDYHDLRIALRLLDEELNENNIPEDEKNLLRNIRNKWQNQKEKTGKQAYQACNYFCNRIPRKLVNSGIH